MTRADFMSTELIDTFFTTIAATNMIHMSTHSSFEVFRKNSELCGKWRKYRNYDICLLEIVCVETEWGKCLN